MSFANFLDGHPTLNFIAYLNFCLVAWGLSLWVYEKATPYREWKMIADGNKAAAFSMAGTALGLALPLCSLVIHAQSWGQMIGWTALSMGCQLGLWMLLSRSAFKNLKSSIEAGVESVGIFLGAGSLAVGAMIAACVS